MSLIFQSGLRVVFTLLSSCLLLTGAFAALPETSSGPSPVAGILQFTAQEGATYSALILPAPDAPQHRVMVSPPQPSPLPPAEG